MNKEDFLEKSKLTNIHKLETMSLLREKLKSEVLCRDLSEVPTIQLFKLFYENQLADKSTKREQDRTIKKHLSLKKKFVKRIIE